MTSIKPPRKSADAGELIPRVVASALHGHIGIAQVAANRVSTLHLLAVGVLAVGFLALFPPMSGWLDAQLPALESSVGLSASELLACMAMIVASMLLVVGARMVDRGRGQAFNVPNHLAQLLDAAGTEVYVFDLALRRFLSFNDAACRGLGCTPDELKLIGPLQIAPAMGQAALEALCQAATATGGVHRMERVRHRRKDGSGYPVEVALAHIPAAGTNVYMMVANDITMRRAAEKQLEFMAHHDPLTELPNRVLFMDRLSQALLNADRASGLFAVMFCDLDLFKRINDSLGHDAGDAVLREVARRLSINLRASDTVARLAGDEFTLLVCGLADRADAERLARKLLRAFEEPFDLGEQSVHVGISIGITLYPLDRGNALELLHHADQAMYTVKRSGRGSFHVYEPELLEAAERRVRIENGLRHAIALDALELCFEPVVDVTQPVGAPAELYRAYIHWDSAELSVISSDLVLETAQQIGMLEQVELWMLRAACASVHAWARRQTASASRLAVIVGLSTWQLRKRDFSESVDELLRRYSVRPEQLIIGLQEGGLLDALEGVTDGFDLLRQTGVQFNVDAFGSGYQRLGRMPRFPVQYFSLDAQVTAGLPDAEAVSALRPLLAAANSLGAKVLAVDVATEQARDGLEALGCTLMSGSKIARPMSSAQVSRAHKPVNLKAVGDST